MMDIFIAGGGPYGKAIKAGPIFDDQGRMFLVALRDVKIGEAFAADAFVRPDFSRPRVGEAYTDAARFWNGWVNFSQ